MDILDATIDNILKENNEDHKRLNWDNFREKLNKRILDEFEFNETLYTDFGDIEMIKKDNDAISIFVYWDDDAGEINVSVPSNRWNFKTEDEAINFINDKVIAFLEEQDELINFLNNNEVK